MLEDANLEDSTARITDALKSRPEDAAFILIQGQILLAQGKGEAGIETLNRAIERAEDAHAHFTLGTAHLIEDNLFAAFKAFETATRLEPEFAEAWLALGGVEMRRLDVLPHSQHPAAFERVMAALDQAEKIAPIWTDSGPLARKSCWFRGRWRREMRCWKRPSGASPIGWNPLFC